MIVNAHRDPRWLLPAIALLAFVSLGLPDTLLGVAWPWMRRDLTLAISDLGWVVAAGMVGYLASCLASGGAVRRLGIGRLLALSSGLVALSLAAIAGTEHWLVLPAAGLVAGLGAGAIDTGINTFAAQAFSPRMVSWLHAAYGVGATTGPALMTTLLVGGAGWRSGYLIVAAVLGTLALLEAITRGQWDAARCPGELGAPRVQAGLVETLRQPAVRWSALLFFVYTGLEVTTAQWSFSLLTEGRGVATGPAGAMVSGYWMSLTAGRVGCGLLSARLGARRILGTSIAAIPILALCFAAFESAAASALGLAGLGVAYAGVFPLLVSDTAMRVGARYADQAMGIQIASAYLGAAALPALSGLLVRALGVEAAPALLPIGGVALLAASRWPGRTITFREGEEGAVALFSV
jgi:fucose permease